MSSNPPIPPGNVPHRIRLRFPWEIRTTDGQREILPKPMHSHTVADQDTERLFSRPWRLCRSFHWLAPARHGQRIFLKLPAAPCQITPVLNDQELWRVDLRWQPALLEVTGLLGQTNRLGLEPQSDNGQPLDPVIAQWLAQHVALEIEEPALRVSRLNWSGDWHPPTATIGLECAYVAEQPTELVFHIENTPVFHRREPAGAVQTHYAISLPDLAPWNPGVEEGARLYPATVELCCGEWRWTKTGTIGFCRWNVESPARSPRDMQSAGKTSPPACNGIVVRELPTVLLPPARTLWIPGEPRHFENLDARPILDHRAGSEFYHWCDRHGIPVEHRGCPDAALNDLREHPCVIAGPRVTGHNPDAIASMP